MVKKNILFTLSLCLFFGGLYGQTDTIPKVRKSDLKKLTEKYNTLSSEFDKLKKTIQQKEKDEELQKLLNNADRLSQKEKTKELDVSKKFHSGVRSQQGLNPNITVEGDFFAGISSSNNDFITEPGKFSYGNNGFYLREATVSMVAPLDPFTRGKTFFSYGADGAAVEEAYIEWLNLPLNINLKTGYFFPEFGPFNRYHDHALPQFDRPTALTNLFGNANLNGFGAASSILLPNILFADATNLDISVFNGGNDCSFASGWKSGLVYIGHFKNYYDLTKNSYIEFRVSGAAGKNDPVIEYNSYIGSLGIIYKWVPVGRTKYRTFDWKSEFLYSSREVAGGTVHSKGFYSSVQNKLNARFWLSGRVGYSELPYNADEYVWDFTINLDFWQSEFVFTRLQYQYNSREFMVPGNFGIPEALPNDHSLLIQVVWAMGPHKHEAY